MTVSRVRDLFVSLAADESGVSSIEYALIASGIALAVATIAYEFGDALVETYTAVYEILI